MLLGAAGLVAGFYIFLDELTAPSGADCRTSLGFSTLNWMWDVSIYEDVLSFFGLVASIKGLADNPTPTLEELAAAGLGFSSLGVVSAGIDIGTTTNCFYNGAFLPPGI